MREKEDKNPREQKKKQKIRRNCFLSVFRDAFYLFYYRRKLLNTRRDELVFFSSAFSSSFVACNL